MRLARGTIAVQKGDIAHDYLLSRGFRGKILPFPTAEEALMNVALKRCAGALVGHVHGWYVLRELRIDTLVDGDATLNLSQDCCFALSKNNEWLLGQIDEGLRILRGSGRYNEIHQRWFGFEREKRRSEFLFYARIILAVVLSVILTIFIWAQLLRRQVRRRTAELKRSEGRYRSLVDKLPDGIVVLRDDEFLFVNRAAAILLTGKGDAELLGTSVLPYLHPEDREAGLVHLSALPDVDAPLSDVRIVRPGSHEIRYAETAGIIIDYHDGPATLIMLRDITERKQAEYAVMRERNLVRAMMEMSPVGILMMDESGVIVFANQQAENIFRLQRAEICQRTYNDPKWQIRGLDGSFFAVEKLPFRQVMSTGQMVRDVRFSICLAEGSRAILSMGGTPLFNAMGDFSGAVLTVEDVTAQVTAMAEQERHWRRLQRQQTAIIHVSQDKTLREGIFVEAAKHIAEHAAETLEVDSASIWLLRANGAHLCCTAAWDNHRKCWAEPAEIPASTIQNYLSTLESSRYIDAADAQNDKRTAELCPGYLRPGNIGALLDVPIKVGARLVGVLCNEHCGVAREWLPDEIQFAVEMADQAGQAYAAEEHRLAEEERSIFESKLQHTQKLESLGVLAGGIAHDFNNLLMAIIGNTELALMDISHANPARKAVMEIETVSRRAAELCRQMLAYSGKGKFVVEPISLNDVISEIGHMLSVSIPKNVVLHYNLSKNLPAVEADVSQMRQVLMNLVINAAEAIGEKDGLITVSTSTTYCDHTYFQKTNINENLPDGDYVGIEVADNGEGMNAETIARIFDPFFTTKFTGRGLGLAAVMGIVRGHHGALKVYSEVGKGTTFKVLLPASRKDAITYETESVLESPWIGSGTILLVDDEEVLLTVTSKMLARLGFEVMLAHDGVEGLEIYRENMDAITCVIMDLTMPNMNGEECFRELRRLNHEVRVILCSGFNEQEATQRFVGKGLAGFIQKPYRFSTLSAKLREILGE
jgi:PAS domain S-box-containing protein